MKKLQLYHVLSLFLLGLFLLTGCSKTESFLRPIGSPTASLVSRWTGDGDANDIIDGNDGTLQNGATFASGVVGQAFSFDGIDDWVLASATNIDNLQQVTIEAWVKHNSLPSGQIERYVTISGSIAVLRHDGENGPRQLHFYMKIDGVLHHVRANGVLQTGVFHHVAGTYDGSVMRLYLDGTEIGSLAISGTVDTGGGWVELGADAEESFDGLLDEISIYNHALNASEIQAIFHAGSKQQLADTKIAFRSNRDGNNEIYVMDADGSNPLNLTNHPAFDANPSWSPTPPRPLAKKRAKFPFTSF